MAAAQEHEAVHGVMGPDDSVFMHLRYIGARELQDGKIYLSTLIMVLSYLTNLS